jgi:hypothetical protein
VNLLFDAHEYGAVCVCVWGGGGGAGKGGCCVGHLLRM